MKILHEVVEMRLAQEARDSMIAIFDPFAGTGKIHELSGPHVVTYGREIEPEWAACHPRTQCGDSSDLREIGTAAFDMIITSPTYGNRFADHHHASKKEAKPWTRRSYAFDLRAMTNNELRELAAHNTGQFNFGHKSYQALHILVYRECARVLRRGGWFVLNVSDHVRSDQIVPVAVWHRDVLIDLGFSVIREYDVPTPRLRHGANAAARVAFEKVYVLKR